MLIWFLSQSPGSEMTVLKLVLLCCYKMAVCDSWSHILSCRVHQLRTRVFVLIVLSRSLRCILGALLRSDAHWRTNQSVQGHEVA